jgi:hypothetical protein
MGGEGGSFGISAKEYSCTQEPKINFGDLTPYLTYGGNFLMIGLPSIYYIFYSCLVPGVPLQYGPAAQLPELDQQRLQPSRLDPLLVHARFVHVTTPRGVSWSFNCRLFIV